MKKFILASLALVMLLLAVSCSTTSVDEMEPIVEEFNISYYVDKSYTADQVYKLMEKFVRDLLHDEERINDKDARTVTVKGVKLDANVGPLAQEGTVVIDIVFQAVENKIIMTINFVESYYFVYMGPLKKPVNAGVTELGVKEVQYQSTYILESLATTLTKYTYLVDNYLL